jgi:UDP-N-acetylmuramoyl-tripeptide--D-alanyl-D-alanine ligase
MGDMLELGNIDITKHKEISKFINDSKINIFLTYGKLSKSTFNGVTNNSIIKKHFSSISSLKKFVQSIFINGDLIYLKGSRSMELERIYK